MHPRCPVCAREWACPCCKSSHCRHRRPVCRCASGAIKPLAPPRGYFPFERTIFPGRDDWFDAPDHLEGAERDEYLRLYDLLALDRDDGGSRATGEMMHRYTSLWQKARERYESKRGPARW